MTKKSPAVKPDQLFCSVDLEFTGFDPSRDQILEIGFAFFKLSDKGLEVVEEWSEVFKPSIEVHPKILGLTGITQQELDDAPEFNEHRDFLIEKLGDAIIVGHNPVMDVKFLESYGIKLSGKVIDTLELVQFILPTHHSYNLENLVHYFGVKHHKAHRALGDALSTVQVLENLLRVYQSFSEELRTELSTVIAKGNFLWADMLSHPMKAKKIQSNDSLTHEAEDKSTPLKLSENLVTIDGLISNHEIRVALGLQKSKTKSVLAVSDSGTVMRMWKDGYAHGVFRSEDTFSRSAFDKFLNTATEDEELRFCLKIIVWLHTNWQTEAVFDLNISFFGGQFRQFIVGGLPAVKEETVVAVDFLTLQTLTAMAKASPLHNRELVVCDIQSFERFISSGYGTRLGWNNVLYSLRLIYNPETDFGNLEVKDEVINGLVATDLFFGLAYMLLHRALPHNQYANLVELADNHHHVYSRLMRAAENLKDKLTVISAKAHSGELDRTIAYLDSFFELSAGRVKWISIDEHNLAFHDQPIDISTNVKVLLKGYGRTRFTDSITSPALLSYVVDRLGLHTEPSELLNKTWPNSFKLQKLDKVLSDQELYQEAIGSDLPLVIVMQTPSEAKDFYNSHYAEIKQNAALFAQGYSGGGNKMFRNFSISGKGMLLATADFIAKQTYVIPAKTVVFSSIPDVETGHPYISALISHWENRHANLESLLAFAKIVSVLKRIKTSAKVSVKLFGAPENFDFVDKPR